LADESLHTLIDRLQQPGLASEVRRLSDGELLKRFVTNRDEAAFEALVWRHGSTVIGVCRRTLGPGPDAEDAFQATFLVLVKQARSIRRDAIGGWLYRVAYRVALRCRAERLRRQRFEQPGASTEPAAPIRGDVETSAALDDAILQLPERYRTVVVMHYGQGCTVAEAAQQLGLPRGTVLSRLSTARRKLKPRLLRQGFAPVALAALAAESANAGPLVRAAVASSHSLLFGPLPGSISAPVLTLTQGALRTMFFNKVKVIALSACAAVLLFGGAGWFALMPKPAKATAAADPPSAKPPPATAPKKPQSIADLKPQKMEAGDDELRRLQKERFNLAIEEWTFAKKRYDFQVDKPLSNLERLLTAHQHCSTSALELAADAQEELTLRAVFLSDAKSLEQDYKKLMERNSATKMEYLQIRHYLIDLEIQLLKRKRELATPAK
jgi:RNA polymerase sigma factor (sigma-70 family)